MEKADSSKKDGPADRVIEDGRQRSSGKTRLYDPKANEDEADAKENGRNAMGTIAMSRSGLPPG